MLQELEFNTETQAEEVIENDPVCPAEICPVENTQVQNTLETTVTMGLDTESVNDVLEPDMRPQSDDQGPLNYNENNAALHKPNWERLAVSTSFGTVYIERLCLTDELVVALKREHSNNDELSKEDSRKPWMK